MFTSTDALAQQLKDAHTLLYSLVPALQPRSASQHTEMRRLDYERASILPIGSNRRTYNMVWESENWKSPLLKLAKRLKPLKTSKGLADDQVAQLERDIFIGFYSVRRLIESPTKVTDKTRTLSLSLRKYANVKPVTWRNNHKIEEIYDLSRSNGESRDVMFVCGRIIHSFVFAPLPLR